MTSRRRVIFGCSATELAAGERAFFREAQPWGFILFARNIANPDQVRALVSALRETVGDERAPVLIDQEGGRVARLRPPHWRQYPAWERFGDLYRNAPEQACEAARLNARFIAQELVDLGINVDCLPVLDVPIEGADAVIGDRAFARDPRTIIALGRAVIDGLLQGGVLPVMKHIPGHGRADADSHFALPRVSTPEETLQGSDFVPFRALNDSPLAMTAHVVYEALDPDHPATTSTRIIDDIIRGWIRFDGLLMSDDLSMKALDGSFAERSRAALSAGCDVLLHCNGRMDEMQAIAAEALPLEGPAGARADGALARLGSPEQFDAEAARRRVTELLGVTA